jgi:methionine synthase I (cobalamin-dependent)
MNAEQKLRALAAEKILIFDGGYGTIIAATWTWPRTRRAITTCSA